MSNDKVHGEGNPEAAARYNEKVTETAENIDLDKAAKDAAPKSQQEKKAMEKAEKAGRERAAETEPNSK